MSHVMSVWTIEKNLQESLFSFHVGPGIEVRSSDLVTVTCTHRAIFQALEMCFESTSLGEDL